MLSFFREKLPFGSEKLRHCHPVNVSSHRAGQSNSLPKEDGKELPVDLLRYGDAP